MSAAPGLKAALRDFFLECCEPPASVAPAFVEDGIGAPRDAGRGDSPAPERPRPVMAMTVDAMKLFDRVPEVADLAVNNPLQFLDVLKAEAMELLGARTLSRDVLSIRLTHYPREGSAILSFSEHNGRIVSITGTIVRLTTKRLVPATVTFQCAQCRATAEAHSDPFFRAGNMPKPRCKGKGCRSQEMHATGQVWMDYAEARVQQLNADGKSGRLPRSVLVALDDELTTTCSVGQVVEVVGLCKPRWKNTFPNAVPVIELIVWAINIRELDGVKKRVSAAARGRPPFNPADFAASFAGNTDALRTTLLQSVCPHLCGMMGPRLGVLLAAVGGACSHRGGHRVRGTIHALFVGDPSTGKSQLLRFAAQIAPRSTSTSGMTSTTAGLTAAATKEFGEWALEPGALVLSDGGTCAIDELRTLSTSDRTSLHEAMEQQTISVAKAGLVTRLRTVCSIVAACNPPVRRRAPSASGGTLATEVGVGGPLLSRFDLLFLLFDTPSEMDDAIAAHILKTSVFPARAPLTVDEVAQYVAFVNERYAPGTPLLDEAAAEVLGAYYEKQRARGSPSSLCDAVPITVRLLESLIRLTQAHAKLVLRDVAGPDDAALAVLVFERTAYALKYPLPQCGDGVYTNSKRLDTTFLQVELAAHHAAILRAISSVVLVPVPAASQPVAPDDDPWRVLLRVSATPARKRPRDGGDDSGGSDNMSPSDAATVLSFALRQAQEPVVTDQRAIATFEVPQYSAADSQARPQKKRTAEEIMQSLRCAFTTPKQ